MVCCYTLEPQVEVIHHHQNCHKPHYKLQSQGLKCLITWQFLIWICCDQISDFCHQQLMRKMRRKISWTDGRTDRGKTVYPPPPSGSGGITRTMLIFRHIFLSNYWWHKSDIWSQASYWYPISWEAFFDDYAKGKLEINQYLEFCLMPLANHPIKQLKAWHQQFIRTL
jgi:hypothetical protein